MQKPKTSAGSEQSLEPTSLIGRRAVFIPSPFGESGVVVLLDDGRWFTLDRIVRETRLRPADSARPVVAPRSLKRHRGLKPEYREKHAEAVALRTQGISHLEIARQVGVPASTVSRWLRSSNKLAPEPKGKQLAPASDLSLAAKRLEALSMIAEGKGIRETAREFGVAPSTVLRWVQAKQAKEREQQPA